jgi:threonylcarbamoyladenosine tRNA methylthiotransferase MtaB
MNNHKIKTFGCRLNFYESEVIRKFAKKNNIQNTTFINSCAVTNKAVSDLKSEIRKTRRENPKEKIILTGCAAQIHTNEFEKMEEIHSIIGNNEKLKEETYTCLSSEKNGEKIKLVSDIFDETQATSPIIEKIENKIRGFVQIQNGCDHRCTFCIIPYGRGNSRSVGTKEIIKQIKTLIDQGYKEIVLTGVDLTSYGNELMDKISLGNLLKLILKNVPHLERLRLSSLDVAEIDENLLNVITNEKRILPHIHLSLQSGDNMILKRMKRRHSREDAIRIVKKIKTLRSDMVFGADLIAGFPTETDEMFQNTVKLVDECEITFLHVFPFSPRNGTPAHRMPQVDGNKIKNRAKILRTLGKKKLTEYFKKLKDTEVRVIVESKNRGRSDGFAKISLEDDYKDGELLNMLITGQNKFGLTGKVIV